jgi:hypothetical protein
MDTDETQIFENYKSKRDNMNALAEEKSAEANCLVEIRLNSGAELKIKAVLLYDEIALAKVNSKKAEAMKLFKGVSTGIGAWGSIEWVLAASAVIGAAEAAMSAGASSAGARLFEEAIQAEQKLRKEGVFIPLGKIQYIESPLFSLWRYVFTKNMEVEVPVPFEGIFSKSSREGEWKKQIKTVHSAFVHNGDEFIIVQTDDGSTCSIRWSAVERYIYHSKSTS